MLIIAGWQARNLRMSSEILQSYEGIRQKTQSAEEKNGYLFSSCSLCSEPPLRSLYGTNPVQCQNWEDFKVWALSSKQGSHAPGDYPPRADASSTLSVQDVKRVKPTGPDSSIYPSALWIICSIKAQGHFLFLVPRSPGALTSRHLAADE